MSQKFVIVPFHRFETLLGIEKRDSCLLSRPRSPGSAAVKDEQSAQREQSPGVAAVQGARGGQSPGGVHVAVHAEDKELEEEGEEKEKEKEEEEEEEEEVKEKKNKKKRKREEEEEEEEEERTQQYGGRATEHRKPPGVLHNRRWMHWKRNTLT